MLKNKPESKKFSNSIELRLILAKAAPVLLISLPILVLIVLLVKYTVNVPFWDQWEYVDLFRKSKEGKLGFADFFAQHNEHRILFGRLATYYLAVLTKWNIVYESFFSLFLAVSAFYFLLLILKSTFTRRRILIAASFMTSLIFFSPIQWENWLWGWQILWFLNVLGVTVMVWALTTWKSSSAPKRIGLAVAASILATYSLGSGLFVWPLGFVLILLNKELRHYWYWWVGFATATVASHYVGYVDPAYHPSKSLFLKEPITFIHYVVVYYARPLNFDFLYSSIFAAALLLIALCMAVYLYFYKRALIMKQLLPWITFAIYGLIAAVTTGISRMGLGVEQAYSNRYITLSNFFIIAFFVVAFKIFETADTKELQSKIARLASIIVVSAGIFFVTLNYFIGFYQAKNQNEHLLKVKHCAMTAQSAEDDCLLRLYPNKEAVWIRLEYLREIKWGGL